MSSPTPQTGSSQRAKGFLAGLRIRKKLIVLHTFFSLTLACVLMVVIAPAVMRVVEQAELSEARAILADLRAGVVEDPQSSLSPVVQIDVGDAQRRRTTDAKVEQAVWVRDTFGRMPDHVTRGTQIDPQDRQVEFSIGRDGARVYWPTDSQYQIAVTVYMTSARLAVDRFFLLLLVSLLGVYALIALALEIFVLPRHVWGPIRALLRADRAVQDGRRDEELVPENVIPADELGEIMRSRNDTVLALRRQETQLDQALTQLSATAGDLQRKNHLLEMAQRNLADADRLASLGILSAGLAHEMNTPLAVAKGLAEKMNRAGEGGRLEPAESELLERVIARLERLSESLLDFARVRPPSSKPTEMRPLVDEAWTLVHLDREARGLEMVNAVPEGLVVSCDADRMVQVFVNLLRNAVDAMQGGATPAAGESGRSEFQSWSADNRAAVTVSAEELERDGRRWVAVRVTDSGPGIDAEVLGRLFEPFATTKLDSRGTGLGLAVSQGIVREHGGLLQARNRSDGRGAVFEILLPCAVSETGEEVH
ncbi:MAG: sensor histidine kinase [Phycisphaerales bacterium]